MTIHARQFTILIVDDDPDYLETLVLAAEDAGYRALKAPSATAALDILEQNPVDLLVTDIMMEGTSGSQLIETIRRSLSHRLLPIIAISGCTEKFEADRLLAIGTAYFLQKPFKINKFLTMLARLLQSTPL